MLPSMKKTTIFKITIRILIASENCGRKKIISKSAIEPDRRDKNMEKIIVFLLVNFHTFFLFRLK